MGGSDSTWYGRLARLTFCGLESWGERVSPCTAARTGGSLLLRRWGGEAKKRHSDFFVGDGKSLGYFIITIGEVSARFHVTLGSHLCVHCNEARKEGLREAL